MDRKRLHGSGRKTFDLAKPNKLYSAREFNRLVGTVSDNSSLSADRGRLFLPVRHAITAQDGETEYPAFGDYPNVYPIKFIMMEYAPTPGDVSRTTLYLDGGGTSPSSSAKDDVVMNVREWGNDSSLYTPYIPEGSIIQLYFANGVWFTNCNVMTTRFRGQLVGGLAEIDTDIVVDELIPLNGQLMGFTSLTALNIHSWAGLDNADCRVEWNAYDKAWELFQVDCP